jgi:hypothetical protein
MPSTDTPTWWADVQQEREDFHGRGRRPAEDWLGEEIDFAPRRRIARGSTETATSSDDVALADVDHPLHGVDHPLHGVFVAAPDDTARRTTVPATGRTIELEVAGGASASRTIELHADVADLGVSRTIELQVDDARSPAAAPSDDMAEELRHLHAADDPFSVPPPAGRRTVQITGRPGEARATSQAQRHRPRTASDRVGHRPDRVALWAVLLGAILILLAATSSSSEAATPQAAPAPAVVHVAPATAAAPTLAL